MIKQCQKCKETGDDHRTLWMSCMYEMNELNLPFIKKKISVIDNNNSTTSENFSVYQQNFYTLRVCKECRAGWMAAIQEWFNDQSKKELYGSGIFIRSQGVAVELSKEEFEKGYLRKKD